MDIVVKIFAGCCLFWSVVLIILVNIDKKSFEEAGTLKKAIILAAILCFIGLTLFEYI